MLFIVHEEFLNSQILLGNSFCIEPVLRMRSKLLKKFLRKKLKFHHYHQFLLKFIINPTNQSSTEFHAEYNFKRNYHFTFILNHTSPTINSTHSSLLQSLLKMNHTLFQNLLFYRNIFLQLYIKFTLLKSKPSLKIQEAMFTFLIQL